jgi:hypothetical protein
MLKIISLPVDPWSSLNKIEIETLLADAFPGKSISKLDILTNMSRRNVVARLQLSNKQTVIVKMVNQKHSNRNVSDMTQDIVGAKFVTEHTEPAPVCARFIAGNVEKGLLIMVVYQSFCKLVKHRVLKKA